MCYNVSMGKSILKKSVNLYDLQGYCEWLLSKCADREKKKDLFRLSDNLERILEMWEEYNLEGEYYRTVDIDGIDMCVTRGELADEDFAIKQVQTVKNTELREQIIKWIYKSLE